MFEIEPLGDEDPYLYVIASGSNGNAALVCAGQTRVLIDAGISATRIGVGLLECGITLSDVTAVVITHEHVDHIRGLPMLLKHRPDLPIYATDGTAEGSARRLKGRGFAHQTIQAGEPFDLGALHMRPFETSHDALEPVGLRVETDTFALGFATDLGHVTDPVYDALAGCTHLLLEANHDLDTLRRSRYPKFLKNRVASPLGHLSNRQAHDLLAALPHNTLRSVVLAHLSGQNNTPGHARATVVPALADAPFVDLDVASRDASGPLVVLAEA